jgi:hypothetical protein
MGRLANINDMSANRWGIGTPVSRHIAPIFLGSEMTPPGMVAR